MAHELLIENGKAAMMYVGDKAPWHGLGQKLDNPATSAEAIKAAHLDWEVAKVPLYMKGKNQYRPVKAKYAVVKAGTPEPGQSQAKLADIRAKREEIKARLRKKLGAPRDFEKLKQLLTPEKFESNLPEPEPLGIVGENYQPLQNREAFAWFDEIVGRGSAIYHTAGALGDGERVWILAKLPGEIRVKGDDVSEKFLLLSNSHDGESSVQVKFTPIRVVCQNTLTMALSSGRTVKISHTRSLKERMEAAKENLGIINEQFQKIEKDFQRLAEIQMPKARLEEYLSAVFPMPGDDKDTAAMNRVLTARQKSGQLFETGRGNAAEKVRGTLWAAYNGIAEFVDHGSTRRDPSQRLESIWFGGGYLTKARAFNVAGKKADEWKN